MSAQGNAAQQRHCTPARRNQAGNSLSQSAKKRKKVEIGKLALCTIIQEFMAEHNDTFVLS